VADRLAPRLAARTPLRDEQARAVLGVIFLGLSTYYVIGSVRRFRKTEAQWDAASARAPGP
jgi:hypothetical protein